MGRRLLRVAPILLATLLVALGISVVPEFLSELELFRLQGIRLDGVRYLDAAEVVGTLEIPESTSVWDDPEPWLAPLREHPLVASLHVRKRLPDSVIVEVTERGPVALVATPLLEAVDSDGRALPLDPSRHRLDLPLLTLDASEEPGPVTALRVRPLARAVERLARTEPSFLERLSELRWSGPDEAVAVWGEPPVSIRFRMPLTSEQVRLAMTAMVDATQRYPEQRLRSVDLRYADQVLVRF